MQKKILGKTGLEVTRLGIGAGYGLLPKNIIYAFEKGINFFFWASHMPGYIPASINLKKILSGYRDRIVFSSCTYFWSLPNSFERILQRHLRWSGTKHIDIFFLGMMRKIPDQRKLEELLRLKEKGIFRFLGVSTHKRKLGEEIMRKWPVDVLMIRYNMAHQGAEQDVFPFLPEKDRPGIIGFNATKHKRLLKRPIGWDLDKSVPTAGDCYRFVLGNPSVDMVLAGPRSREHIDEAVAAVEKGPLSEEELKWMREFGDLVHGKR